MIKNSLINDKKIFQDLVAPWQTRLLYLEKYKEFHCLDTENSNELSTINCTPKNGIQLLSNVIDCLESIRSYPILPQLYVSQTNIVQLRGIGTRIRQYFDMRRTYSDGFNNRFGQYGSVGEITTFFYEMITSVDLVFNNTNETSSKYRTKEYVCQFDIDKINEINYYSVSYRSKENGGRIINPSDSKYYSAIERTNDKNPLENWLAQERNKYVFANITKHIYTKLYYRSKM